MPVSCVEKSTRSPRTFRDGSVISLRLKNFQVFKEQMFYFGPSLNLIAAPNGSGKSAVANALALAFNGSAKTIGKARDISEYVRFGEEEAEVAVTVQRGDGIMALVRQIRRAAGGGRLPPSRASSFYVDGKAVSPAEYAGAVASLGIDVNSLCTFLPQERVAEFAAMTPAGLLEAVLAGTGISTEAHESAARALKEAETALAEHSRGKDMVETALARMEAGMEALRAREAKERELERLGYKLLRVEHDEAVQRYRAAKKEGAEAAKAAARLGQELKEAVRATEMAGDDPLLAAYDAGLDELVAQNGKIKEIAAEINKWVETIDYRKMDRERAARAERERTEEKEALEKRIKEQQAREDGLTGELKEKIGEMLENIKQYAGPLAVDHSAVQTHDALVCLIPSPRGHDARIDSLTDRARQIQYHAGRQQHEIEELEQQRLAYSEQSGIRMELLKKYHLDTYKAVQWLRENKSGLGLHGPVLEPLFLHIAVDKHHAAEVETLLSFQALSSFLVSGPADFTVLTKALKDERGFAVNIAEVPDAPRAAPLAREALRAHGVDGVALDFVDCAEEYRNMLCAYSLFNAIPVARGPVDEAAIFEAFPGVRRLVAGGQYTEIRRSAYGQDWIISSSRITARNLFAAPKVDLAAIATQLEALHAERDNNKKQLEGIYAEREALREEKQRMQKMFDTSEICKIEYSIGAVRSKRVELMKQRAGLEAAVAEAVAIQAEADKATARALVEIKGREEELMALLGVEAIPKFDLEKVKELRLELENARRHALVLEAQLKEAELNSTAAAKMAAAARASTETTKQAARAHPRATEPDFIELGDLPDEADNIKAAMRAVSAQLELLAKDKGVLAEFAAKQTQRAVLGSRIEDLEAERKNLIEEEKNARVRLAAKINGFLEPLDFHFQRMFAILGFAGRIALSQGPEWELHILVKFRESEELQRLTGARQSGGERSLTTAIFLLALQQCTDAPFRLVDEINQGMDAVNERAVFKMIKETGTKAQLFIITPKLVDGLEFASDTNAIIIYGAVGMTRELGGYVNGILDGSVVLNLVNK